MEKILLLEDDISLIDGLKYSLEKNGFLLTIVRTVGEARRILSASHPFDLLLLDVTLPDGSGFEICDFIRQCGDPTPIIFLTAADEETSIIRRLDSCPRTRKTDSPSDHHRSIVRMKYSRRTCNKKYETE